MRSILRKKVPGTLPVISIPSRVGESLIAAQTTTLRTIRHDAPWQISGSAGLEPQYLVVGEPTGSKMMRLQKGMLKVRLSCRGVACHSGYPHLGVSAIDPLVEVLHAVKHRAWPSSEELGDTTVNIGLMQGGQAANALAEASEAVAMFRLIGDPEEVLSVVKAIAAEHDCAVEVNTKVESGDRRKRWRGS